MSTLTEEQRKRIEENRKIALEKRATFLESKSSTLSSDISEVEKTSSKPSYTTDAKRIKLDDEPIFSSTQSGSNSSKLMPPVANSLIDEKSIIWLDKNKYQAKQNVKPDSSTKSQCLDKNKCQAKQNVKSESSTTVTPMSLLPFRVQEQIIKNLLGVRGSDDDYSGEDEDSEDEESEDEETGPNRDREIWVLGPSGPRRMKMVSGSFQTDDARSEATIQCVVPNFSRLKKMTSPAYIIRNLPWKIMVMPRANQSQDQKQKSLGIFLQCEGESESSYWPSYHAVVDLKLLSVEEDDEPFSRRIQHFFTCKDNDCGFSSFMEWDDVLDPDNGYIKDDSITLEVEIKTYKCGSEWKEAENEVRKDDA